jgi:hypothetical protein
MRFEVGARPADALDDEDAHRGCRRCAGPRHDRDDGEDERAVSLVRTFLIDVVETIENDVELQRRLRGLALQLGIGTPAPAASDEREFDSIAQFAKRIACSRRHVHDLRERGMVVTIGSGRAIKIDVARTLDRLRHDGERGRDVARLDEARERARAAARNATKGVRT